jgi:3-hydroxybutyryl-CoA dehydrogenase
MGIGIVHALALAGSEVVVVESDDRARDALAGRLEAVLARGVARRTLTDDEALAATRRVSVVDRVEELPEGLDVVIEAVPEQLALKRAVLAAIEARGPRLLASNTSALSIDALAEGLTRPADFLGLHFFNPVWSMALVEVVRGAATDEATLATALELVALLGKEPVVVADRPGFATSRLGVLLGLEAVRMLEEGVASAEDIDRAMQLGYGHPMGPLRLSDLVGLDVRLAVAEELSVRLGERFTPPERMRQMVAAGLLGRKTGQGFYTWPHEEDRAR